MPTSRRARCSRRSASHSTRIQFPTPCTGARLQRDAAQAAQVRADADQDPAAHQPGLVVVFSLCDVTDSQGETFGTSEATETFFAMTKLFQNNDVCLTILLTVFYFSQTTLRRMVYLTIKEMSKIANDVIIVTQRHATLIISTISHHVQLDQGHERQGGRAPRPRHPCALHHHRRVLCAAVKTRLTFHRVPCCRASSAI